MIVMEKRPEPNVRSGYVAELSVERRDISFHDLAGDRVRIRFFVIFRRERHMLQDFTGGRIDNDEVVRFACRYEQSPIRAQSQSLRSHARQFDLQTRGRENLIDRSITAIGAAPANSLTSKIG